LEADSARSEAQAERTARERAEADAADARRRAAEPVVIVAPSTTTTSPATAQAQADAQKAQLRRRLMGQLNGVLDMRDTPRGLVATISDASFNGSGLRGSISGQIGRMVTMLQPYPALQISVEGYSDNAATASQAMKRAEIVRHMLTGRGFPADRVAVRGLGDSRPLASNTSATGREQNRRVEIVISGDPIGTLPSWDRTYSLTQR
jgi:outer membrane protein OmpA-like peptidoglycan-associated protein